MRVGGPLLGIARRIEVVDANGRHGVRDPQDDFDRTQRIGHGNDEALNEAVLCLDNEAERNFSTWERRGRCNKVWIKKTTKSETQTDRFIVTAGRRRRTVLKVHIPTYIDPF